MRSILVHADHSPCTEARLQTALALARRTKGHVTCHINTPFNRFIAMDPFGGAYISAEALSRAATDDAALEERLAAQLGREDVPWTIDTSQDELVDALTGAARLADLVIISADPAQSKQRRAPVALVGALALSTRTPLMVIPTDASTVAQDAPVMIAWDGGIEAANALKASLGLLAGRPVHVVTVAEKGDAFPSTEAVNYLSRHDIHAELHSVDRNGLTIEETLEKAAQDVKAGLVVMGAYGHSRLRETLFGGVTRYFIDSARFPLLLAH